MVGSLPDWVKGTILLYFEMFLPHFNNGKVHLTQSVRLTRPTVNWMQGAGITCSSFDMGNIPKPFCPAKNCPTVSFLEENHKRLKFLDIKLVSIRICNL